MMGPVGSAGTTRLDGLTALVTGGDSGIGRSISLGLARAGARIVVDYHGQGGLARAVVGEIEELGGRASPLQADVSDPDQVERMIQHAVTTFGGLDILVNNAGLEEQHPFLEMPLAAWSRTIAVDLTGVWLCSQSAARQMVAQGRGGRIINISSIHEDVAMPTNAPYCAAKGGVRMLMRTLAVELAPYGITVNNICPGAIDTKMDARLEQDPDRFANLLDEIPLHRMGRPAEVADLCAFLASDAGTYITGASYVIDGGMSRQAGSL